MTQLERVLRQANDALADFGVRFALIGGLAVSIRTEPRFTRDDDDRPQDLIDLRALLSVASAEERERLRRATTLITSRGYHRGRDLGGAMEALLAGR